MCNTVHDAKYMNCRTERRWQRRRTKEYETTDHEGEGNETQANITEKRGE
jgi:hypothetical protein